MTTNFFFVQMGPRGHPGCTSSSLLGCHALLPSCCPDAIVPSMTRPTCPPIQHPGGGVGGGGRWTLCLAPIVSDTRFHLTDTRANKREKKGGEEGSGGGGATTGHYSQWRWKDETRWPSVVHVCNLYWWEGGLCVAHTPQFLKEFHSFVKPRFYGGRGINWGGFPLPLTGFVLLSSRIWSASAPRQHAVLEKRRLLKCS